MNKVSRERYFIEIGIFSILLSFFFVLSISVYPTSILANGDNGGDRDHSGYGNNDEHDNNDDDDDSDDEEGEDDNEDDEDENSCGNDDDDDNDGHDDDDDDDDGDDDDGGNGGGSSTTTPPQIVVSLSANPISINLGATTTLTWTSQNTSSCNADWTTATSTSGSHITSPVATTTYTITCGNGTASSTATATVLVISINNGDGNGGGNGGGGGSSTTTPPQIVVSLSANPISINLGATTTLTWTSQHTNSCSANWTTATSTSGNQIVSPATTTIYEIICSNNTASSTATTTVSVNSVNNNGGGNGGGGGSSGGGGSTGGGSSRESSTLAPSVVNNVGNTCFYLRDYMRGDFDNDPVEVLKLQGFLINFEGHNNVSLSGVFDEATFDAVSLFQTKYASDILEPWGHTAPTGYVYILTLKKINEIYCQRVFPLNQTQLDEITAFRTLLEDLGTQNIGSVPPIQPTPSFSTSTLPILPIVGEAIPSEEFDFRALASVIFAIPDSIFYTIKCLYEFVSIFIVLYMIGTVLKNVLYRNNFANIRKKFYMKWLTITVGVLISIIGAYFFSEWCLILPLFVTLVLSIIWLLSYSKHGSLRASVKSWYLVIFAVIKSNLKTGWKKMKKDSKEYSPSLYKVPFEIPILPIIPPKKQVSDMRLNIFSSQKK